MKGAGNMFMKHVELQRENCLTMQSNLLKIFVEFRELTLQLGTEVQEYFLGLCDTETLRKWKFCSADLEKERPNECIFKENTEFSDNPSRVHRRLCDVTGLAFHAELCNCAKEIDGNKLLRVTGFPTCFLSPLPESLCSPRNVCGVAGCNASTINHQVHRVQCNPKCIGGQPFCEFLGPETSRAAKIDSYWTDWIEDLYDDQLDSNGFIHTEAMCINKNTGMGAIDCLGPGTNCCSDNTEECKCYIYIEDGILKLFRKYKIRQQNPQKWMLYYKYLIQQQNNINNKNKMQLLEKYYGQEKREDKVYEDADYDDGDLDNEDVILEENVEDEDVPVLTTSELVNIKSNTENSMLRGDNQEEIYVKPIMSSSLRIQICKLFELYMIPNTVKLGILLVKNKLRNLKTNFIKAEEWKAQTGVGLLEKDKKQNMKDNAFDSISQYYTMEPIPIDIKETIHNTDGTMSVAIENPVNCLDNETDNEPVICIDTPVDIIELPFTTDLEEHVATGSNVRVNKRKSAAIVYSKLENYQIQNDK
ncbi:hypothetical protein RN001_004870 [Aquatica leii]|uniref:Uncharacterized protein n=1 Tax=Aquatica leii TaxID=1421715 RepID=A0AAN7SAA2_9COLE|nr:hypothetical protein RN001_004870 [Aquatica leii]